MIRNVGVERDDTVTDRVFQYPWRVAAADAQRHAFRFPQTEKGSSPDLCGLITHTHLHCCRIKGWHYITRQHNPMPRIRQPLVIRDSGRVGRCVDAVRVLQCASDYSVIDTIRAWFVDLLMRAVRVRCCCRVCCVRHRIQRSRKAQRTIITLQKKPSERDKHAPPRCTDSRDVAKVSTSSLIFQFQAQVQQRKTRKVRRWRTRNTQTL